MKPRILSEWLGTGRHSRCPQCLSVDGLKVRRVLEVTGPAFVAGVNEKYAAAEGWEYRCFDCGATGSCQLKTPEERGRWVDGLGSEPYE